MIAAVTHQYAGGGEEEDDIAMVNRLCHALPHSTMNDLIFHDFRGLTPEQVVDEAMQQEADYLAANPKTLKMTRDEALRLVNEAHCRSSQHSILRRIVADLHRQFPHAEINDLIFHNPLRLTPEQVVDEANRREAGYLPQTAEPGKAIGPSPTSSG